MTTLEGRLNRNGRPWGVPRMHVNKRGEPKPARSREESIAKAIELSHDRALKQRGYRKPISLESYECVVCGWWHEGSTPSYRRKRPVVADELGGRAWSNVVAENRRSPERRVAAIVKRARRARGGT